jgi:adenylate cyclase class IV
MDVEPEQGALGHPVLQTTIHVQGDEMTHQSNDTHFETEKGFRISKGEYKQLRSLLPTLGFAFVKKSLITDFVVPTNGETTRRIRIENIKQSSDGATGVFCLRCQKRHPIKGASGKHVREETEESVVPEAALSYILESVNELGAPIPYYSKKRWNFHGRFSDCDTTISLDHATGIGTYSGYYIEIEVVLPLSSERNDIEHVLKTIEQLAAQLLHESRPAKVSYRKMLMRSWIKGELGRNETSAKTHRKVRHARRKYRKNLQKVLKEASGCMRSGEALAA